MTGPDPRRLDIGVFGGRSIPSTYSGYETFLTTLLPALHERGHRVTMYCRRGVTEGNGPYLGVRRRVLPALPGKQFNTLSHGAVASVAARAARHDVLLVVNVANALVCAVNTVTGQPVVLNTDGQEWLRGKWGTAERRFFHLSARLARFGATGLVADCAAMAEVYADQFGASSTVIPYCYPEHQPSLDVSALEPFGVSPDSYVVVAGRLNPENNIAEVAEAYAGSSDDRTLLVLGTANYASPVQSRLDRLASADRRIRPLGHVGDRRSFLSLIGLAGTYVHGHSVGGMNPSLVEAMGSGALVAALGTTFNRETLGPTGRYFSTGCGDLPSVLAGLRTLVPEHRASLRQAASKRVLEQFDVASVVDAYEALLVEAASGSSRRSLALRTRWPS